MSERLFLQATGVGVAIDPDGPLWGILLLGASGAGKSTLALSLIVNCPWRRSALIADDGVWLTPRDGRWRASAPDAVKGLIEVRGLGPAPVRTTSELAISTGFDLSAEPERLNAPRFAPFDVTNLLPIYPFRAGSDGAARLRVAARAILGTTIA